VDIGSGQLALRLVLGGTLGAVVGFEREAKARTAGIRTHALVALGATLFTVSGAYGFTDTSAHGDPTRVAAQVAAGVGFIGAGAILRHGASVVGVTTAASIWLSAAIGVAVGSGAYAGVLIATVCTLGLLTLLHAVKSLTRRIGRATTLIELEYERGFGTLGPLLRGLETLNGRVESISIHDDDDGASAPGRRRVCVRVIGPANTAVRAALSEIGDRAEIRDLLIE
jgi:putative Mg2+ transporter-C (MgtC) family protein